MTIDVYADIACPWCYLGRARLQRALDDRDDEATLRWRPFQLQPDLPPEGADFRSVLEAKFGNWNRAQRMFQRIQTLGAEMDLTFDFDAVDAAPNTADAHRLVLWAQDQDVGDEMATELFRAYFSEGRNVSEPDVLVDCATEVGVDADEARSLLRGDDYADEVRESQQQAERRGITGVPCYVFGDEHVVTGAQPVDVFVEALDALRPQAR
jgi:predicted DsbA family dithiol-disulfide isomerase